MGLDVKMYKVSLLAVIWNYVVYVNNGYCI